MNKGLIFSLGVLVGAGGGYVVCNKILGDKYAQKADEEIAACRNAFLEESARRRKETEEKGRAEKKAKAIEAVKEYSSEPEAVTKVLEKADIVRSNAPYVIAPEIYDDPENPNVCKGLRYYPDGPVVKADGTVLTMEELDKLVGRESLVHFGGFGEASRVCVRNEELGIDYEICMMPESYAKTHKEKPGK